MPTSRIDAAAADVAASLRDPSLARVSRALDRRGLAAECRDIVSRITTIDGLQERVCAIRAKLQRADPTMPAGALERVLILQSALDALRVLPVVPVSADVKRLFCEEFEYVAHPSRTVGLDASKGSFVALCQLASFRRYPAGQFHWEVSGIPRSWLFDAKGHDRVRLFHWIAAKLKGFGPVFFSHLNANRRNRSVITEREANRSYYRMAESMALQPAIRGLVTRSWLHSPDTFAVSPHLAGLNRTFLENGGLVVVLGPADPAGGVLTRSPERQKLYEEGRFKPTDGLVVWPRAHVLAWAAKQPGFAEAADRPHAGVACDDC